jgi:hypothetical protein
MDTNHKKYDYTTPADFGVWEVAYKVSETDFYMQRSLAKAPINSWAHQDDSVNVQTQQVIRENQDIIYSSAVVDIRQGATMSVPPSDTYHIIEIIDYQNYVVGVLYPGESRTITPDDVTYGDYVYLNMRIRPLPDHQGGLETTHKLQRLATIEANSAVPYVSPEIVIEQAAREEIRAALVQDVEQGKAQDTSKAVGNPYQTRPQEHLYGCAYGWGGLPLEDAAYFPISNNQSKVEAGQALPASLTFTPPGIDYARGGFWSITTYNAQGWLANDKASICNSDAEPNVDGSYTIHFNSPGQPNNIDTPAPFAALMRIYIPASKAEILAYLANAKNSLVIK